MNKNIIRRTLTSLFACAMTGTMLIPTFAVNADTKIAINEKNFPDDYFRYFVSEYDDLDHDGYLSSGESKRRQGFSIEEHEITDLKGIEYYTNLESLYCEFNYLTKIDLSKNTKLKVLCVDGNKLDKLDLSKNTQLEHLSCQDNILETLDISKNTELSVLWLSNGKLRNLDLSKNTKLKELCINNNKLDKLDLSKNTELSILECEDNLIETIDLSKNTKLNELRIGNSIIRTLDLSKNPLLKELIIENSILKTLDLSNNKNIVKLYISNNNFEKLVLSKNDKMESFEINNNGLTSLDLSFFPNLQSLYCSNNAITSLDLKCCPKLGWLDCSNNKLTEIDLSDNPELGGIYCQGNQIDYLDVSGCEDLLSALKGDKEQKNGYVIYESRGGIHTYVVAVDDKTIVNKDAQFTVDSKTKKMFLDQDSVVPLVFEGADDQTQVTMTSSDDSIVKIGNNNTLIPSKAGSSDISAKVGNKTYKFKVTVYYKDVKDNTKFWFVPAYALTEKGVVKGYDNQTTFKPANKCTRAQMVTFIWRLAGQPNPKKTTTDFNDIKTTDYFYKPVLWAVENGITTGVSKEKFNPQGICTRAQTVTFLWRMAGKPAPKTKTSKFTDIDSKDYFYKATLWASEMKIVAGYDDNTFRPQGKCLRRQMVTFLYKYDKFVNIK